MLTLLLYCEMPAVLCAQTRLTPLCVCTCTSHNPLAAQLTVLRADDKGDGCKAVAVRQRQRDALHVGTRWAQAGGSRAGMWAGNLGGSQRSNQRDGDGEASNKRVHTLARHHPHTCSGLTPPRLQARFQTTAMLGEQHSCVDRQQRSRPAAGCARRQSPLGQSQRCSSPRSTQSLRVAQDMQMITLLHLKGEMLRIGHGRAAPCWKAGRAVQAASILAG